MQDKTEELKKIFEVVEEDKRQFAYDTIDEYLFFKNKINELKKLPLIRVHPKRPELQEVTSAGKLIKDYSQIVDSKRATLLRILYRVESSAADELMKQLMEYE